MSLMLLSATLLACIHPTPPGPSPAELAEEVPAPIALSAAGAEVHVTAVIQAGSAHDPVGAGGTAWLTARLLRSGGTADLSPEAFEAALEALGATLTLSVDKELVRLEGAAPLKHGEAFAAMVGALVATPGFAPEALDGVRDAATDGQAPSAEVIAAEALDTWLNQGHPYGHPITGSAAVRAAADAEALRAFHADHYTRDAVSVGVSAPKADLDSVSLALSEPLAGLGRAPYDAWLAIRAGAPPARELLVVDGGPDRAAIALGAAVALPEAHPDRVALALACIALSSWAPADGPPLSANLDSRSQPSLTVTLAKASEDTSLQNAAFTLRRALRLLEEWPGVDDAALADALHLYGSATAAPMASDALSRAVHEDARERPSTGALLLVAEALTPEDINRAFAAHLPLDRLRAVAVVDDPSAFLDALFEENETLPVYSGPMPDSDQLDTDADTASWPLGITPDRAHVADVQGVFQ